MFLNVVDTQMLFRAVVYFVQQCSNSTRGIHTYVLITKLEHVQGTRGVRAML